MSQHPLIVGIGELLWDRLPGRKKHEKGWTTVPMNQREREQFYLSQARELGQQLGDSPELAQLCRAAYEDYRQGLLSGTAYDKIQALCADLAHPH